MRFNGTIDVVAGTLFALMLAPVRPVAQEVKSKLPHYTVTDLGTLGDAGTNNAAYGINNEGWISGSGNLTANGPQRAFLWYGGQPLVDLGTLGGPDCPGCNSEAGGPNASGDSAILSEISNPAYKGEDLCGFGTHRQCLAAIWKNGKMKALANLPGGHNGQAYALNNQGQVIGFSETGTPDPTCSSSVAFQILRFAAALWEANGEIHELRPYKDDTVAFAFGINDYGQAVGSSGLCSDTSLPPVMAAGRHTVLWERDGSAVDLGNLGGTSANNVATSINNRGEVAGNSQSSKDGNIHPFVWTRETGMRGLSNLPGAIATVAPCCHTLNDRGEVVGFSIDSKGNPSAFVWRDQRMMDTNTLIPPGSPLCLQEALSINDAGGWWARGSPRTASVMRTSPPHVTSNHTAITC
jgi:probable HAF family extracellular repeat protein